MEFDFDWKPYKELKDELLPHGIQCGWNSRHQMTISTQTGAIWPTSNSFWVTRATGEWLLFPWCLDGYRLSDQARIGALCLKCMASSNKIMRHVPKEIVKEFQLALLTETESADVFLAMDVAG